MALDLLSDNHPDVAPESPFLQITVLRQAKAGAVRASKGVFYLTNDQEPRMTIADMVYQQVKLLPDPLAREVLDFVVFLREGRDRAEWRDLMNAQATGLAAVWDNPEDKVWDDV